MGNNNLIIYSIKSEDHNTNKIHAFFETQKSAADFAGKFKAKPELEITRQFLSPNVTDHNNHGAFSVLLHNTGKYTYDQDFYELICTILQAKTEEYILEFRKAGAKKHSALRLVLYVTSRSKAIKEAIVIRDVMIKAGEWELAFLIEKETNIVVETGKICDKKWKQLKEEGSS